MPNPDHPLNVLVGTNCTAAALSAPPRRESDTGPRHGRHCTFHQARWPARIVGWAGPRGIEMDTSSGPKHAESNWNLPGSSFSEWQERRNCVGGSHHTRYLSDSPFHHHSWRRPGTLRDCESREMIRSIEVRYLGYLYGVYVSSIGWCLPSCPRLRPRFLPVHRRSSPACPPAHAFFDLRRMV